MQTQLAFSQQLAALAVSELSAIEKELLNLTIYDLFNDLNSGHSCSILKDGTYSLSAKEQAKLLLKSNLANQYYGFPAQLNAKPVSIVYTQGKILVYISKYLQYELDILHKIKCLSGKVSEANLKNLSLLGQLSAKFQIPNKEQYQAIANCLQKRFSIITGGPGTGKTTTVSLLLWLLYQSYGDELRVKICAPTGKASKRVKDSIQNSIINPNLESLDFGAVNKLLEKKNNFLTIHKLLGHQINSIYFKYNKNNLLDLDVLIVDESSMVSLPLFSKLLQAIDENNILHVILLGDSDQLSSVEEGYVFASMVNARDIKPYVTRLVITNRSNHDIANLAGAIQEENIIRFNQLFRDSTNIKSYKANLSDLFNKQLFAAKIDNSLKRYFKYIMFADLFDIKGLFNEFNRQIILCLTNLGIFGTLYLNVQIERKIKFIIANIYQENQLPVYDLFSIKHEFDIEQYSNEWYTGRPIIILENDYGLELFNGDIGICIVQDGKAEVVFENGRKFIPEILPKYQLAYAITVHKSQGSEYEHVNLVLCDNSGLDSMSALLSKELLYTGITRAKNSISIFAGEKVLAYAIRNKTSRATGLDIML